MRRPRETIFYPCGGTTAPRGGRIHGRFAIDTTEQPPLRLIIGRPRPAIAPPTPRAARLWSWADPLRPVYRRHSRLARACLRCAALATLAAAQLLVLGASRGASPAWWVLAAMLIALLPPLLVIGVRARRRAVELEREIAEREAEAERCLDAAS